jgi:hypothetical protein
MVKGVYFFSCHHGLTSHYGLQYIFTRAKTWLTAAATAAAAHATHK